MQGRDRRWGEDSERFVSNVYLLSRHGKGKRIDASALSCVPLTYSDRELLADVAEPAVPEQLRLFTLQKVQFNTTDVFLKLLSGDPRRRSLWFEQTERCCRR